MIGPNNALHFYSATAATHSQNISETGQVSAAVFPSHGPAEEIDGLQFSASCRPIETSDELAVIHAHYFKVNFKPEELDFWFRPADKFLGNAPQRFYEIDITEAWVYDEERFTNTRIDGRTSVDLNEMWQQLDL